MNPAINNLNESAAAASTVASGTWLHATSFSQFIKRALIIGFFLQLAFVCLFAVLGIYSVMLVGAFGTLCFASCLCLERMRMHTAVSWLLLVALIVNPLIASWIAGWSCGFQYFAWVLAPLVAFNDRRSTEIKLITLAVLIGIYVGADFYLGDAGPVVVLPGGITRMMRVFSIACSLGAIGYISLLYSQTVHAAEQRFRKLAITDTLTGLYNRRHLLDLAKREIERAQRLNYSLSIIVVDIDHFKRVNDTHGHLTGDLVIASVAEILRSAVRQQDHVARWGGEEFLILMPNNNQTAAQVTAERIRQAVGSSAIGATTQNGNERIAVTVTLGISEWRASESIDQAIARADSALYHGKQSGRNRTELSLAKFAA